KEFFGGSSDDLSKALEFNFCPILRKDFIIDEYQVIEAKSIGADVLLLIAAALDTARMEQLSSLARSLGLEVLIEVHSEEELQKLPDGAADAIGVNNRDLKTFTVRRELSLELSDKIPHEVVKVSESGIEEPGHLLELRAAGYRGFLIGERFMREARPHDACRKFIEEVQRTAMK
ncbi:MAG: indole-3-glycerol-phosphate synthase, partial [Bdellovibrionales bacterium]|nr:indole-3-glycerol-phosphate synthase [Bdellovibrionales bacterium]